MTEYRELYLTFLDGQRGVMRPVIITGMRLVKADWQAFVETVPALALGPQPWDAECIVDLLMRLEYERVMG